MAAANNTNLLDEFRSSLSPPLLQSLLHRLLSHPKIFNGFVDVLKLPSVQATLDKLDGSKRDALVKTVELFSYGTIGEYFELKAKDEVWTLNDAQLEKLRMLSVASVARSQIMDQYHQSKDGVSSAMGDMEMADSAKPKRRKNKKKKKKNGEQGILSIPYSKLAAELRIPDNGEYDEKEHMRPLEDLLIQCVYSSIISAKLDQSSKSLRIESHVAVTADPAGGKDASSSGVHGSVFSRDLNTSTPESTQAEVSRMICSLESFLKQSNSLLATLEKSSKAMASDRKDDEMRWKEVQKVVEESPSRLREAAAGMGGGGMALGGAAGGMMGHGGNGGDPMEVVDLTRQVKRSKGGHSMMMGGGGGNVRFG